MSRYFAQVDGGLVSRVIVCADPDWPASRLGGTWVETADPYGEPGERAYCGPGHGYDPDWPLAFAPVWQPWDGTFDDDGRTPYQPGSVAWHNGHLWASTTPNNVWEPGVSGWRRQPVQPGEVPPWQQPTGEHDAYKMGEHAAHNGKFWKVVQTDAGGNNVWEPGVFGWEEVTDGTAPTEARPTADVAVGLWTPTPLHTRLQTDSDHITSANNEHDTFTVACGRSPAGTLTVRLGKSQTGGHVLDATLSVHDGPTLLDTWTVPNVDAWQTVTRHVPAATDLRVTVTRAGVTGGAPNTRRSLQVSSIAVT